MEIIKGPDFPTGGIIYGRVESFPHIPQDAVHLLSVRKPPLRRWKKNKIIVHELPYQVKNLFCCKHCWACQEKENWGHLWSSRWKWVEKACVLLSNCNVTLSDDVVLNHCLNILNYNLLWWYWICDCKRWPKFLMLKEIFSFTLNIDRNYYATYDLWSKKKAQEKMHILKASWLPAKHRWSY